MCKEIRVRNTNIKNVQRDKSEKYQYEFIIKKTHVEIKL